MEMNHYLSVTAWLLILNAINLWTFMSMPTAQREEDFFGVRVTPEVYRGAGRHILHQYWFWLVAAFIAIEVACALVPVYLNKLVLGLYLQFATTFLIPASCFALLDVFHGKAEVFKVEDRGGPAASFALSLKPRRLSDYTHPAFEAMVAIVSIVLLLGLAYRYPTMPGRIPVLVNSQGQVTEYMRKSFSLVFSTPTFLIYTQGWLLLLKHARVQGPLRLPTERTAEYLRYSEASVRLDMNFLDSGRGMALAGAIAFAWDFIFMPAEEVHSVPKDALAPFGGFLFLVSVIWLAGFLYYLYRSRVIGRKLKPVEAADLTREPIDASHLYVGGLIYYNPDDPARIVKGPRWYTLNLANKWSYIYVVYPVGVLLLAAWWLWSTWLL